jgi:hypothetical protein
MISTSSTRVPQGVSQKIASRIAQCLLLALSTDKAGEAVAAVAAARRAIDSAGLNIHSIADAVQAGLGTPPAPPSAPPASSAWRSTARFCRLHEEQLSPKEIQFLDAIMKYRGDISPKQVKWLADIAERIGG